MSEYIHVNILREGRQDTLPLGVVQPNIVLHVALELKGSENR